MKTTATNRSRFTFQLGLVCVLLFACTQATSVEAETAVGYVPKRAKDIGVDEKLGAAIRLETIFRNDRGVPQRLSEIVAGNKPMLLTLNYSGCPGLCVAQLDGLVQGLEGLSSLKAGKDFEIVSISIDPRETPETAAATKAKYTKYFTDKHDAKGWHFLIGELPSIAKITEDVGFRYSYDEKTNQFNHAAVAIAISSEGKITRYLYDVGFQPETIKMAMIEAGEGRIGTPMDAFVLWCMPFDPNENRYSADARKLLSLAAGAFALLLICSIAPFWLTRKKPSPVVSMTEPSSEGTSGVGGSGDQPTTMSGDQPTTMSGDQPTTMVGRSGDQPTTMSTTVRDQPTTLVRASEFAEELHS